MRGEEAKARTECLGTRKAALGFTPASHVYVSVCLSVCEFAYVSVRI